MEVIRPYLWIQEAKIFNKNLHHIPSSWFYDNADILVVLFSQHGADRRDIVHKFCQIYEESKTVNMPIEVINVPMEDTEADMLAYFDKQANWFTLKFDDPIILILKYMYEISCVPFIIVLKVEDSSIISHHGIRDVEKYGKNAVITWLSTSSTMKSHRNINKELNIYGEKWNFLVSEAAKEFKQRFSIDHVAQPDKEAVVEEEEAKASATETETEFTKESDKPENKIVGPD